MEQIERLAVALMDADKAYRAAHDAAYGATDPAEKVRLDLIKRRALRAYTDAKLAYDDALDEMALDRRTPSYATAAE